MSRLDGWLHRLRVLVRGERYAREQSREVEFHLELEAMAQRSSPDCGALDAELQARRNFGNVTYYREEARRMSALGFLDRLRQDVRYAFRGLRRQPGFTAMVVVTLALGFGVNAAMFSLLNRLFLHQPDGVVRAEEVRRFYTEVHNGNGNTPRGDLHIFDRFQYPQFRAMREAGAASSLALTTQPDSTSLRTNDRVVPERFVEVSSAYFTVLGITPTLGRFFVGDEDSVSTATHVVVISDQIWRTVFDSRRDVLGERVKLGSRTFSVVGVAPVRFRGIDLDAVDLWVPLNTHQDIDFGIAGLPWYVGGNLSARLIGRAPTAGDQARLVGIVQNALRSVRIPYHQYDSTASALAAGLIETRGPMQRGAEIDVLRRIASVTLLVLAIAVANVINLLLLRATSRRQEIALRRALGVSVVRLLTQLVVESTLLSVIAAIVAVVVGHWSGTVVRGLVLPQVHWATPVMNRATVTFLFAVSVIVGLIGGTAPALDGNRFSFVDSLKAGRADGGYQNAYARSVLLAIQAALSVILFIGANLFGKSLSNMKAIDLGYAVDDVIAASPGFSPFGPSHQRELRRGIPEVVRRLTSNPAVASASYALVAPLMGMQFKDLYNTAGELLTRGTFDVVPSVNVVSPSYFDATGLRVVEGRSFERSDTHSASRVTIVNETMAHALWPHAKAVGQCLLVGKRTAPCSTVIGVVSNAHRISLVERPPQLFYLPATQYSDSNETPATVIVRARAGHAGEVNALVAAAMREEFPESDFVWSRTLYSLVARELQPWNIAATLFTAFGILAFIVAGVGIYSVVAYGVAQRTRELGIRIALGATRAHITDLVVGSGLRAVGIGIVIGLVASWLLAPLVRSLLFGVTTSDLSTYIGAATALCMLGVLASLVPALRAARVDPVVALRSE